LQSFGSRYVSQIVYNEKDNLLIAGLEDNIQVWNLYNYECVKILNVGRDIKSLLLLPNMYLASGAQDGSIAIWNASNFEMINILDINRPVYSLIVLKDNRIISASDYGAIIIWNY
jgi:WD40 repeat protein